MLLALSAYCAGAEPTAAITHPTRWEQFISSQPQAEIDNLSERLAALAATDESMIKLLGQYMSWEFTQYETRIDQLEDLLAQQSGNPIGLQPAVIAPVANAYVPNPYDAKYAPIPTTVRTHPTRPANPIPTAPSTPTTVPDSWQRLNIKGQWFYIIPVKQAVDFDASQGELSWCHPQSHARETEAPAEQT